MTHSMVENRADGSTGLLVQVDEQNLLPLKSQTVRKIDGGSAFSRHHPCCLPQ